MALKRHKHHIGNRYIEVYRATGDEFLAVAGGASNEAQAFLSKGAQVIIRMRGLPYDCTVKQVLDFFNTGESHCEVLDGPEGVLFVKKHDGRSTGDAFVLFANEADAPRALSRHRESIGQRYIELFRSTTAEVQQVLNRSLDPKTYEISQQPPLIAQLPTVPLSLLPQHFITSGTTKNCIRLRGLPYEALVENILHFLDDFAKHIIYQGVHMVINAQGQPSGEAFIQMDSEESARLCAQRKHNQFMVFGKKYRYIEVFQCSGADMYLVLNGGLQSLGTATGIHYPHPHSAHTAGKQPSLLPPGMLKQTSSVSAQTINSTQHRNHPSHITSTHIPSSHTMPPALQPTMSTDAAALSQSAHSPTHLPLAAPPTAVQPNAQSAMLASIMSAQNSVQPVTGAPHPSALVPSSIQQNLSVGGSLGNLHTASTLSMAPPANPNLAFNLPPPQNSAAVTASVHNSALFAQQQAQFIAQQTLLARQQAAAAVAAQHHQQQQQLYFAANLMNPILMQHTAATLNVPQALASPSAAGAQPQFFLMPRPSYFQSFPIEQAMPTLQTYHQFDNAGGSGMLSNAAANVASPSHFSTKRSYEHAFQQDVNAASTAKRAVTRAPTGVYPYFNPGI